MRKCNKCGLMKDESEFGKNKRTKDGLHYFCKECKHAIDKSWSDKHREQLNEAGRKWRKENPHKLAKQYDNRRNYLLSLKQPCAKCGESRPHVIEFHHRDPSTKSFNVGYTISNGSRSKVEIELELEKCVFLCANCHAEFHWFYGKNPKEPLKALEEYLNT